MHTLICAFVVRIWHKQVFSWRGSYDNWENLPHHSWLKKLQECYTLLEKLPEWYTRTNIIYWFELLYGYNIYYIETLTMPEYYTWVRIITTQLKKTSHHMYSWLEKLPEFSYTRIYIIRRKLTWKVAWVLCWKANSALATLYGGLWELVQAKVGASLS